MNGYKLNQRTAITSRLACIMIKQRRYVRVAHSSSACKSKGNNRLFCPLTCSCAIRKPDSFSPFLQSCCVGSQDEFQELDFKSNPSGILLEILSTCLEKRKTWFIPCLYRALFYFCYCLGFDMLLCSAASLLRSSRKVVAEKKYNMKPPSLPNSLR